MNQADVTIIRIARAGVGQAAVAIAVVALAHKGEPSRLTVSRLMDLIGKSQRSVRRGIKQLQDKGILVGREINHDFPE